MKFLDYDRIIRQNRQILIDSYVEQYGEENREIIEKRFDQLKFCFFENPKKIRDYINIKSARMGRKMTLELFKRIGMDSSQIQVNSTGGFTSSNPEIKKMLEAFFPDTGYITYSNSQRGIFCFLDKYDEDSPFNLMHKALVLQSLGHIENLSDVQSFLKSEEYKAVKEVIDIILRIAEEYRQVLVETFDEVEQYARLLERQERDVLASERKNYLTNCIPYMTSKDRILLSESDVSIESLASSKLFAETNHEGTLLCPGLLEYFLPEYSTILQNSSDTEKKELIRQKRLKCLSILGINIDSLSEEELENPNWHLLPGVFGVLPSLDTIYKLKEDRESYQKRILETVAQMYVINNYNVDENTLSNDALKDIIFGATGRYGCRCQTENGEIKSLTIFISPLDGGYDLLDIILDHEIRHGLEYSARLVTLEEEIVGLPAGTVIEELKTGLEIKLFIGDVAIGGSNKNINEVMTQMMSIESTKKRYDRGIYILTNPEEAHIENTSDYDPFISNFNLAFPEFVQRQMIRCRLTSRTLDPVYQNISQDMLSYVNSVIRSNDPEVEKRLQAIGESLKDISSYVGELTLANEDENSRARKPGVIL